MNTQARAHLQSKPRQANIVSAPTGRDPAAMENCFSTSRATSKVACFGEGVHWQWPQPSQLAMSGHVRFDLFGDMLDALVQTPPVTAEVLNDSDLRGDKDVDALGQNFWELMAQKAKPLADRNAVLSGRCTDSAIAYASRKSFL